MCVLLHAALWRADFKDVSPAAAIKPPPDLHIICGCSIGPERLSWEKRRFDSHSAFQSERAASEADRSSVTETGGSAAQPASSLSLSLSIAVSGSSAKLPCSAWTSQLLQDRVKGFPAAAFA